VSCVPACQFRHTNRLAPPLLEDVVAKGPTTSGVYHLDLPEKASAAVFMCARNAFKEPQKLVRLHAIFNHAYVSTLKHLKSLPPMQLPVSTPLCSTKCDACLKGNVMRAPDQTRAKKGGVLQLIDLDRVGPFSASRDGNKYCCKFEDDSSGYVERAISKTKGAFAPIIVRKLRFLQHPAKCKSARFIWMERENCAKELANNGQKRKALRSQITVPQMDWQDKRSAGCRIM
jgi:hypothetical protein